MNTIIKKAVIPAAGFGTRFLPWTKSTPKELIPIITQPIIEKIVRGLVSCGVEEIIIFISPGKETIKKHFEPFEALERQLELVGKTKELATVQELNNLAKITFRYQQGQIGNATPIYEARDFIGNEPFFVSWADDYIRANESPHQKMLKAFAKYPGQYVTGLVLPKPEDKKRYGYVAGKEIEPGLIKVEKIIEKPGENAPSDIGIVSDYLYTPKIFNAIEKIKTAPGEELVYTLPLAELIAQGEPVYCTVNQGEYADCGNPLEYIKTLTKETLEDGEIGQEYKIWLKEHIKTERDESIAS